MSEFFDELITGLNEAVAIERGELKGFNKKYRPCHKFCVNGRG